MVLLHRREADLRLLVEMKGRTIAAVKVPLRLSALSSRQG
jgi:hypothetical protein